MGDAVLSLIIGDILFEKYPNADEGMLSQMRAKMVNREFFNSLGAQLELESWIRMDYTSGKGIDIVPSMLGNAFEALFGAIFLDQGYKKSRQFFNKKILKPYLNIDEITSSDLNYKSRLLEWGQKNSLSVVFKLRESSLAGNLNVFMIEVLVDGVSKGQGRGTRKKKAEQEAAHQALIALGLDRD